MANDVVAGKHPLGTGHQPLLTLNGFPTPPAGSLAPDRKSLPEYARLHNRTLLMRTLYRDGPLSRADLARSSGLTKVSVSDVVADLVSANLVGEVGTRPGSRPGKPATLLAFNEASYQVIGVDLSHSTLFRGTVLDLRGNALLRREIAINDSVGEEACAKLTQLIMSLQEALTAPLLGVGVGVPGMIDTQGAVVAAPTLGWNGLPLRHELEKQFGCHVVVGNAANLAAYAERIYGNGADDMILVRVGVAVSAGILLNGTPVLGSHCAAGEIGHVTARTTSDRPCVCGREGCLEAWLSTRALRRDLDAAVGEDGRAEVLINAGHALGAILSPIVAALNTSEIVLSGPPLALRGLLSDAVMDSIRERVDIDSHGAIELRQSLLDDDIVIRGATAMVMSHLLDIP